MLKDGFCQAQPDVKTLELKLRTLATDSWGVDTSEVEKVAKGLNNAVIAKVLTEKELTLEHEIWRQMQEEVACGWLALVDDNSVEN